MKPSMLILALDVATTTGWARGRPGEVPTCGSQSFEGKHGATENAVFGNALRWLSDFVLIEPKPELIVMEQLLPMYALEGETQAATRDRLAGLQAVFRAVAFCRGIFHIETVAVQKVRQHFCGDHRAKKADVRERCHQLRWPVPDNDAADAAALWDYAACLADPALGIKRTPMFGGLV